MLIRKNIRMTGYDYSQPGWYFVTICTQDRKCIFGTVVNGSMVLNKHGVIVERWWNEIPNKYSGIELDIHQVMPNHFHGVINIVGVGSSRPFEAGSSRPSLGQIVAYFKYQSTKFINELSNGRENRAISGRENRAPTYGSGSPTRYPKLWQRNYYEHVIRTEEDLDKIRAYIQFNPQNWETDRNNTDRRVARTADKTDI